MPSYWMDYTGDDSSVCVSIRGVSRAFSSCVAMPCDAPIRCDTMFCLDEEYELRSIRIRMDGWMRTPRRRGWMDGQYQGRDEMPVPLLYCIFSHIMPG